MTQADISTNQTPKDDMYYWDSAVFMVEGTLFKIPKFHLIHGSERFTSAHGLLAHNDVDVDGELVVVQNRTQPIVLNGIVAYDFRSFLEVLYPRTVQITISLPKDQWISVLKVSTLWFFNQIRKMAIEQLDLCSLTPVEHISLGKQFHISRWLLSGYDYLVKSNESISLEAAKDIGMESTVRLYICREQRLHRTDSEYLKKTFADELAAVAESESQHLTDAEIARLREEEEAEKERCAQMVWEPSLSQEDELEILLMHEQDLANERAEEERLAGEQQREHDRLVEEALERERVEQEREAAEQELFSQQAEHLSRLELEETKRKEAEARVAALEQRVQQTLNEVQMERAAHSAMITQHKDQLAKNQEAAAKYRNARNQLATQLKTLEDHNQSQAQVHRAERDQLRTQVVELQAHLLRMEKDKKYMEMGVFFQSIAGPDKTARASGSHQSGVKLNPARMSWNGHDNAAIFESVEETLAEMSTTGRPQKRTKTRR